MTDPDSRPQPAESPQATAADRVDAASGTAPGAAPAAEPAPVPAPGPTAAPASGSRPTPEPGTPADARPEPVADAPADTPAEPADGLADGSADTAADAAGSARAVPPVDPQLLFGSLSLASIEADIDAMMNDKMTELNGMLAGLEELVVRLEGEITSLEAPPDDSPTP